MGGPRGLLLERQECQMGHLLLRISQFDLAEGLGRLAARGHLGPGDFAFDDARGVAVIAATGSELETVGGTRIGAAIAERVFLGLGEGDPLGRRGVVLVLFPDRDADAGAFGCGGVAI